MIILRRTEEEYVPDMLLTTITMIIGMMSLVLIAVIIPIITITMITTLPYLIIHIK